MSSVPGCAGCTLRFRLLSVLLLRILRLRAQRFGSKMSSLKAQPLCRNIMVDCGVCRFWARCTTPSTAMSARKVAWPPLCVVRSVLHRSCRVLVRMQVSPRVVHPCHPPLNEGVVCVLRRPLQHAGFSRVPKVRRQHLRRQVRSRSGTFGPTNRFHCLLLTGTEWGDRREI